MIGWFLLTLNEVPILPAEPQEKLFLDPPEQGFVELP